MSKKKGSIYSILWWVGLILCLLVLIGGSCIFLMYRQESTTVSGTYSELVELRNEALKQGDSQPVRVIPTADLQAIVEGGVIKKHFLRECTKLYELNNDLVGWVSFPDTVINYPVMQTKLDNRDYYLYRDFYKKYNRYGCVYVAEDCNVFKPSDNVTLYGHHMLDGSMFASLVQYEDPKYWKKHQYFTFDTLYEHHTYQVVAAFKISASSDFRYHMFTDASSPEDFAKFWGEIEKRQFYDTGIDAVYGDKIVCLSTCEYSLGDGRFVVVGKRIS